MVTLSMDIRYFVVGFHVWLVAPVCEVEGYVKKVNGFFYWHRL